MNNFFLSLNDLFRKFLHLELSRFSVERQAIIEAKKVFGNKKIVACEVGVFEGEHAFQMLKNLNIKKLYLVDPYSKYSDYEKSGSYKLIDNAKSKAKKKLLGFGDKVCWIEKFSDDALLDIKEKLDFVYIDGNHFSPYVDNDIVNYYPLVKTGGILAGHDYSPEFQDVLLAVHRLAKENKKKILFGKGTDWVIKK
jgi:hypothetical protein